MTCGACGHEHAGPALGGICVGCPCPLVDQPAEPAGWWDTGACPECARAIWWQTDAGDRNGRRFGLVTYYCRGCDWQTTARDDQPLAEQFGADR